MHKKSLVVFFFLLSFKLVAQPIGSWTYIDEYQTWDANPRIIPSTDPAGICWNPDDGKFYIVDSEINEDTGNNSPWDLFGSNVFTTNGSGSILYGSYHTTISTSSREPTGIVYNPQDQSYYITNDDTHALYRYTFVMGVFTRQDTWILDNDGPLPNMDDPEGITLNPFTQHFYIVDGNHVSGGTKVIAFEIGVSNNLIYIPEESFDLPAEMTDGEGIAYRFSSGANGNLFVVSSSNEAIYEFDLGGSGTIINKYDMSGLNSIAIQGLTFGPRSTNSSLESLYIADAELDNNDTNNWEDGRIYEIKIGLNDTSLPIELSSFAAEVVDNAVNLNWVTASELNNVGFELHRATEEFGDYQLVSSYRYNNDLVGQINSNTSHEYSFIDTEIEPNTTYWYKLADVDINGLKTFQSPVSIFVPEFSVQPVAFKLYQNYPNPFNPSTTIKFDLNGDTYVNLEIFNSAGQLVKTLINDELFNSGSHEKVWNGDNNFGEHMPAGFYIARITANSNTQTIRMIMLK
ncbi:MAG: T9SS type A sorting domain-containing protein [Calditrichae bacterium]|nr:T9SS type A sorting domain-containing protein [Calditrichia bacterium]